MTNLLPYRRIKHGGEVNGCIDGGGKWDALKFWHKSKGFEWTIPHGHQHEYGTDIGFLLSLTGAEMWIHTIICASLWIIELCFYVQDVIQKRRFCKMWYNLS